MTDTLQHHELTAEWVDDKNGPAVMLTQTDPFNDDPDTVLLHPWQLRAVCEQFDLMPTSDPQAAKTIAALTRRLHLLRDRIDFLADWLVTNSDSKHADLSYEQTYARATADIADEFCTELVDAVPPGDATSNPATPATTNAAPAASPQASLI